MLRLPGQDTRGKRIEGGKRQIEGTLDAWRATVADDNTELLGVFGVGDRAMRCKEYCQSSHYRIGLLSGGSTLFCPPQCPKIFAESVDDLDIGRILDIPGLPPTYVEPTSTLNQVTQP